MRGPDTIFKRFVTGEVVVLGISAIECDHVFKNLRGATKIF